MAFFIRRKGRDDLVMCIAGYVSRMRRIKCLFSAYCAVNKWDFLRIGSKYHFWIQHMADIGNDRQGVMISKLMDNFEGNLKPSKWTKMTKVSAETALRDITDLVNKGVLSKTDAGGISTD